MLQETVSAVCCGRPVGLVLPALLLAVLSAMLNGCGTFPDAPDSTAGCRALPVRVEEASDQAARPHVFAGPEDITIDQTTGIAFVSVFPRAEVGAAIREQRLMLPQGGIYALDIRQVTAGWDQPLPVRNLTQAYSEEHDFHPHGISLLIDPVTGEKTLFVINHAQVWDGARVHPRHSVLRFRVEEQRLVLENETALGGLCNANDVAAVGADRFFVTSTNRACDRAGALWDLLRGSSDGSVVLYDQGTVVRQWPGLRYANGISLAPGSAGKAMRELYVAESLTGEIHRYTVQLEPEPALLNVETVLAGGGLVDNLEWTSDGELSVGAHPSRLRFGLFALCQLGGLGCDQWPPVTATSPSAAFRFKPGQGRQQLDSASLTYADDGRQLSGSSVAAIDGDTMLIGSVFSDTLVLCSLGADRRQQASSEAR